MLIFKKGDVVKNAIILDHPVINHKLSIMRDENTETAEFRRLAREIGHLMAYEVSKNLETENVEINTPLKKMASKVIKKNSVALVSILRAGNGILDGFLDVITMASVGFVGLERDHETHQAKEYYFKLPGKMEQRDTIVVDPMLATGNSAIAAIDKILETKPKSLSFVCLLAAPEGVEALKKAHPEVQIYTAALDECLNENAYIVPGLGDAGDRIYGTL